MMPPETSPTPRSAALVSVLALMLIAAAGLTSCFSWQHDAEDLDPLQGKELVVIVHGLGRTEASMIPLSHALEEAGYEVLSWGYSSFCCRLETIGQQLASELERIEGPRPTKIHFVGHSFGNLVIRQLLTHTPPPEPGRVVMLAPPNQGSTKADRWAPYFSWMLAPLDDLVTDPSGAAASLPPIRERAVGIIAGRYDGKVSIDETRMKGTDAHIVVPSAHTFIMADGQVHALVLSFLETGVFEGATPE
ncbi:hypothetical protein FRC98_16965 [Lujinxingia vulgaris]|uniref:DUF676 domain-containing protein n=1 Tax=Lujinxingia vulgaris TaxID=2600176 RepID=A0A5C6X1Y7_9DELT|nr:hypothetical protein [Lujinxingia vulgaris]TXD35162.1 hypothetical protein FRC98_16965 [Lujinxingia vulgaris]